MSVEAEAGVPTASHARRRRSRLDLTGPTLLGFPVAWLVVFFVVPIGIVAAYSVDALSITTGPHPVTLTGWRQLVTGDPFLGHVYLSLFWKSVKMSVIVSAIRRRSGREESRTSTATFRGATSTRRSGKE